MKAKNKFKYLFASITICLAMFIGMVPMVTFAENDDAAEINGTSYTTLTAAINAVPKNTSTTIKMLKDVQESITIGSEKDVILNLNGHTLTLSGGTAQVIVKDEGKLEVKNGTITSNVSKKGAIDVSSGCVLKVSPGTTVSHTLGGSNGRQAIFNKGGTVYISNGATLTSTANDRATVHNLNDGDTNGTITITGGEITSNKNHAVYNEKA